MITHFTAGIPGFWLRKEKQFLNSCMTVNIFTCENLPLTPVKPVAPQASIMCLSLAVQISPNLCRRVCPGPARGVSRQHRELANSSPGRNRVCEQPGDSRALGTLGDCHPSPGNGTPADPLGRGIGEHSCHLLGSAPAAGLCQERRLVTELVICPEQVPEQHKEICHWK